MSRVNNRSKIRYGCKGGLVIKRTSSRPFPGSGELGLIDSLRSEDEKAGIFLDPDAYLYAGDTGVKSRTFLSQYWTMGASEALGLASCVMQRVWAQKPIMSGIHWYPIIVGACLLGGRYMDKNAEKSIAERDMQFFHYMRLNPKDFAPPKRVKYRDYVTAWIPHR